MPQAPIMQAEKNEDFIFSKPASSTLNGWSPLFWSQERDNIRDFFSTKICPLAYFTTTLARISCPIAFQVISEIFCLDLFLKTSVEGMFPTTYVDVR
jgi:hypothetical protein